MAPQKSESASQGSTPRAGIAEVGRFGRMPDPPNWESNIATKLVGLADFDSQNLAQVVAGADFEHRLLPGGGFGIDLLQCWLPHSVINGGTYSPPVLVNGILPSNAITFATMLHQKEATIINGREVRSGTIQFYAEKSEMSYRSWPNATWLSFVITRERLVEFCTQHLDEMPHLPHAGIITIESRSEEGANGLLSRLRDLDHSLRSLGSLRNAARLGESIENDLLATIANFISANPVVRNAGDRHRLRLCADILRDTMQLVNRDPKEMFDISSMAKATGLSPRTLQRTFQAEYGLCPQEWLRVERLHRVREDLFNNPHCESVTYAATRWGFFHLGRFSQYYAEVFGERPSQTFARRASPAREN